MWTGLDTVTDTHLANSVQIAKLSFLMLFPESPAVAVADILCFHAGATPSRSITIDPSTPRQQIVDAFLDLDDLSLERPSHVLARGRFEGLTDFP